MDKKLKDELSNLHSNLQAIADDWYKSEWQEHSEKSLKFYSVIEKTFQAIDKLKKLNKDYEVSPSVVRQVMKNGEEDVSFDVGFYKGLSLALEIMEVRDNE
mgnify:CR=1 FL=1